MNLQQARVVLRPRTMTEVMDLGLRFAASADLKLYLWLCVWTLLPCFGLCLAGHYAFDWEWGWVWALALAMGTLVQGVFTIAAGRLVFAEEVSVKTVLKLYFKRFWAHSVSMVLTRFIIAIGLCFFYFVIPPIWAWSRVTYVSEAVLLERASVGAGIKRGSKFAASRGGAAMSLVTLGALTTVGFVVFSELLFNVGLTQFLLQLGQPLGTLWEDGGSPFALLGFFMAIPYFATARFLAYIDQRTRQDGWDIQLKFMAAQARAGAVRIDGEEAA